MLNLLVGLIERWWREKPRLDLVRAVVRLKVAMTECQSTYETFRNATDLGEADNDHQKLKWHSSIVDLNNAILEIDQVLTIFDSEARMKIQEYVNMESIARSAKNGVEIISQTLNECAYIDVDKLELMSNFEMALERLNLFIRSNFKPEEIHAAHSSKWR